MIDLRSFDYSKLENLKIDMEIINYLSKIHEYKGRQDLYIRQKPAELDKLVEIAKIQSTESSNIIEGIFSTSTRIKELVKEKTTPRNRSEKEIVGYKDVLNTIHESHDLIPIEGRYILQLHRDLMKPAGFSYGGSYKNTQNYINETLPDGTQVTRFTPVAPYETASAIDAICESFNREIALEKIDPLILIPCFIIDFLCIHPFNDGNGRMSRLLTLLLLYRSGFVVGKYISIEKQIEKTKEVYYDVLENANQGWHEELNDPTPFIKYMLQMILACYVEFEERVNLNSGISSAKDIVRAYTVNKIGKFTGADVIINCPTIGRSAILKALKELVEEGSVERYGTGRSTYYVTKR